MRYTKLRVEIIKITRRTKHASEIQILKLSDSKRLNLIETIEVNDSVTNLHLASFLLAFKRKSFISLISLGLKEKENVNYYIQEILVRNKNITE